MNLNLATAAFFSALVEITLCMGLLALWSREKVGYLLYWSTGFLAWGIGAMLVSLRDKIPDFLSILVANLITILSSVLFYIGICLFFNRRRSWLPWMFLILGVEAALLAYYTYITYNTSTRIYAYSAAQILIAWITVHTLFVVVRERAKSVNPEVVIVTSLLLLTYSARMVGTPFFPAPQNFLASGDVQTLLAFGMMVLHITYALVFGNMHISALNAELSAALADAKAKEQQKVEVLSYIGHDLRAPLTTISGYSQLLLADAPEKQHKLLQTIQRSVKYQLDLIDELLEYTKAELQPLAVRPSATDLPLLLGDIAEYAIALCSLQSNRFRYQAPDRMPRQISLDGKRLQQVLLNLLSNAAKFTRDGVVTLSVTAKPEDGACALRFAVSDTGIGIDLNQGVNIFGAFQQIQAASGSTGLGLFIAQRIASAMGGSLSVTSTPGQGTTFSFALSVPVIDASDADWLVVQQPEAEPSGHSLNSTAPRNAMPEDQALDELANLALHGRLTDIERWIEHHTHEATYAPFAAQLRELLERFDFSVIHALAVRSRSPGNASMGSMHTQGVTERLEIS